MTSHGSGSPKARQGGLMQKWKSRQGEMASRKSGSLGKERRPRAKVEVQARQVEVQARRDGLAQKWKSKRGEMTSRRSKTRSPHAREVRINAEIGFAGITYALTKDHGQDNSSHLGHTDASSVSVA
ncbi:hypothetical protein ACLB2K_016063 [Fragaria x ananassa]